MKILVFGATGRVGNYAIEYALDKNYQVTAFVRNKSKLKITHKNLRVVEGDVYQQNTVIDAMKFGFDVVVGAVGGDVFQPSTLVGDSAKAIVDGMKQTNIQRYIGVSGIACLKGSLLGNISLAGLKSSPIRYAVKDHEDAFKIVSNSGLNWTLLGCPYIKDGEHKGVYELSPNYFPGGFKNISPQDVADFIVKEIQDHKYPQQIVGIWY